MQDISGGKKIEKWILKSGQWIADPKGVGFNLIRTKLGNEISDQLSIQDISSLFNVGSSDEEPKAIFPPEFKFSPNTGKKLHHNTAVVANGIWIPPYGTASIANRSAGFTRGLRHSVAAINLSRTTSRSADEEADVSIPLPPAGDYEFFSIPSGGCPNVLLALDPEKGQFNLWLPATKKWELLTHDSGGELAESRCGRIGWRCEISVDAQSSVLFLPTEEGLACVTPDAANLSFSVKYIGNAPAIGSPLQLGEQIWLPLRSSNGSICFISGNQKGEKSEQVELLITNHNTRLPNTLYAPLTTGRIAIWPADTGQLLLRKEASGRFSSSFQPWPDGIEPSFNFGSPYLSRDGGFWQLCFNANKDSYVYIRLGVDNPEMVDALTPRLCTGNFNFRFKTKFNNEPWLEPEHGDDGGADELVLPLLESAKNKSVLGLKLQTAVGLSEFLNSVERMRAVLILDSDSSQVEFSTIAVAKPWRLRFFTHSGHLWAYHPLLNRINGWSLES